MLNVSAGMLFFIFFHSLYPAAAPEFFSCAAAGLFLSAHQQNAGSNPIHKRRVMLHKQKRRRSFQQQLLDLHAGKAEATVWTDDLTHEYVHINADYES